MALYPLLAMTVLADGAAVLTGVAHGRGAGLGIAGAGGRAAPPAFRS